MREQVEVLEHHADLLAHPVDMLFVLAMRQGLVDLHTVEDNLAAGEGIKVVDGP